MVLLVPIFALLFFCLCWRRPLFAAYIVIAALPAYLITFRIGPLPSTFLELMILILSFVLLIRGKIEWKKIYRQPFFWPLLAILFASLFSALMSPNWWGGLGLWRAYFLESLMFIGCLVSLVKTRKDFYGVFVSLGISALYLSLFSFWQKFSAWGVPSIFLKPDGSVDRVTGVFGYPNALGLYLGPIIILFSGWLAIARQHLETRRRLVSTESIFKIAVIICSFITIVLAQSEAAVLAVLAVWFLLLLYFKKTRILALILLVIGVIMLFALSPFREFVLEKVFLRDWSGIVRRQIWVETIAMLKDHWFLGGGFAGYTRSIVPYHTSVDWMEIYLYPHNIILNFWSEFGLLGLLAFIWLGIKYFWVSIKDIWRSVSKESKIISVTLTAVMLEIIIHGLVDVPFFKNDLSIIFLFPVILAVMNNSLAKEK